MIWVTGTKKREVKKIMTEEKKIEITKQYLNRYREQRTRVEWQKQKLDGLRTILNADEESDDLPNYIPDEAIKKEIGWDETEKKFKAESVELCKIYREIMDSLDLISTQEMREIVYEMYIHLLSIDGVAYIRQVHPKTISKKHRAALIELYDILNP